MYRVIIIGGGISGLATAFLLEQLSSKTGTELEITLLEKEPRLGGKIWTIPSDGYLCEWGPNGFLDNKPQTLDLCKEIGAAEMLLRSNDNARKRFIFTGGELHRLPENPPSFLKSRLISWPGKFRLAMEPFIPPYNSTEDETLASFGRRRLGDEALRKLIAPMVSGIFAGNPETMSLVSCFPRIAELEREYGSLIKAMLKLAKKKKQERLEGKVVASAAGPGGVLTSFRDGIQTLTDTIASRLTATTIHSGVSATKLSRGSSDPFRIQADNGEHSADAVIMATPAYASAGILQELAPRSSGILQEIPYASMTVVCFGYERERIRHDLNGFGYLIPKEEGVNTLGTLWDSSIFDNRAPSGHVLLRSMMGGACFPEYINLNDSEVTERVKADLKTTMGISSPPSFVRIFRHKQAIPQYTVGHSRRLASLDEEQSSRPGLFLTGNSYRGIGLNDCVAAAERCAAATLSYLEQR